MSSKYKVRPNSTYHTNPGNRNNKIYFSGQEIELESIDQHRQAYKLERVNEANLDKPPVNKAVSKKKSAKKKAATQTEENAAQVNEEIEKPKTGNTLADAKASLLAGE